jgi:hypothetical protein
MIIPKRFKMGAVDFKVKMLNKVDAEDSLGLSDNDEAWIKLKRGLNRQRLEHTMCHELMHCLFWAAGRDDLGEDEQLVDVMGALLHQYLETQRGEQ